MIAVWLSSTHDGGAQWGPRFLLIAAPALIVLAAANATDALGMFEVRTGRAGDSAEPRLRATFVVDPPRDESDLSAGPVPQPDRKHEGGTQAAPVSVHAPFSPWLWLAVFILVALEGVVRARKRWGERLSH